MKKFKVWIPDVEDEEDAEETEAWDAKAAACSYVEAYHDDSAEYPGETVAHVRDDRGVVTVLSVTWEPTRVYRADPN